MESNVLNYRTCFVASKVKERRWNKNQKKFENGLEKYENKILKN